MTPIYEDVRQILLGVLFLMAFGLTVAQVLPGVVDDTAQIAWFGAVSSAEH